MSNVVSTKEATTAIEMACELREPLFLSGAPGIGKSNLVAQVASKLKRKLVDIRGSQMDPVDLRGLPAVDQQKKVTEWIVPNFLPPMGSKDKWIIFLDELLLAPPLVLSALYQLILDRRCGDYVLPDEAVVIAASNRPKDKTGVGKMPTALANRFMHLEVEVDVDSWLVWAYNNGIDPAILGFIRFRPDLLHKFDPTVEGYAFPTPRSWEKVNKLLSHGETIATNALVAGTIGSGPSAEFLGFRALLGKLPDIDYIIANPDKFVVPSNKDVSVLYAIVSALVKKCTKENSKAIFTVAAMLPSEYGVVFLADICKAGSVATYDPNVLHSFVKDGPMKSYAMDMYT